MESYQTAVALTPSTQRGEYRAHLEANYQRLVAQLYAMTLNPTEAHELVQEAYTQAWRQWPTVSRLDDPTGWIRGYAVWASDRGWRRIRSRLGMNSVVEVPQDSVPGGLSTTMLLGALREMPIKARRSIVLRHMAGLTPAEIGALERVPGSVIEARLAHGRDIVMDTLAQSADMDLGYAGGYA